MSVPGIYELIIIALMCAVPLLIVAGVVIVLLVTLRRK